MENVFDLDFFGGALIGGRHYMSKSIESESSFDMTISCGNICLFSVNESRRLAGPCCG